MKVRDYVGSARVCVRDPAGAEIIVRLDRDHRRLHAVRDSAPLRMRGEKPLERADLILKVVDGSCLRRKRLRLACTRAPLESGRGAGGAHDERHRRH